MLRTAITNPVLIYVIGLSLAFAALVTFVDLNTLIVLENGILTGCGVAIFIIFWRLILDAVQGKRPYSDVRQMALSIVLLWAVIGLSVASSLQLRAGGYAPVPLVTTALARYGAIIAAVMQVTVPDYGLGIFYGRERKTLWAGILVGAVAATLAVVFQVAEVFAA